MFLIDDVGRFYDTNRSLDWLIDPSVIPVGKYAAFKSEEDSPIRLLDLTGAHQERHLLFGPTGS